MSAKRFGEIMRDTMGGAGPGPGWSRWWKATDEATWLSLMPPVVKMVYDKEIDLAPDGTLMKVDAVQTPYTVDNVETGADGALYGGTIPLKYTCREVCSNAPDLAATKVVGGREVGCGRSPGGALRVRRRREARAMLRRANAGLGRSGNLLAGRREVRELAR